jgi:SAM-dependent methyltransferase
VSHGHGSNVPFSAESWDERYRSAERLWSGNPNPQLVAEVADLPPGRALDAGCGEGADAIWLAQRGWDVVGADLSTVAVERAARHARETGPVAAARIEWRQADLVADPPERDGFDLVSAQFLHLPPELRSRLFAGLAAAVRAGGTLLVVGHHPSDLAAGVHRPSMPELYYTGEEIADVLDGSWAVLVDEARPRRAVTRDGEPATIHDAVFRARRATAA